MKLIVVTYPRPLTNETKIIKQMLADGVDRVHVRKPDNEAATEAILSALTSDELLKVTVHYFDKLALKYGASAIEKNFAKTQPDNSWQGLIAASCHSVDEVARFSNHYDYCFLSPIFDSISKIGYHSSFSDELLKNASLKGIVNNRVIALGGILPCHIAHIAQFGFGGIAVLGGIWGSHPENDNIDIFISRLHEYMDAIRKIETK